MQVLSRRVRGQVEAYASSIQMDIPGVELLDVSAVVDDDLTLDQWIGALREVGGLATRSGWWLGDLFILGQSRWGKGYAKRAAHEAGLTAGTVLTYAYVSRSVPAPVRRSDLSHTHHVLVASIRDSKAQARWLEHAARRQLTVEEFRRALGRGEKPGPRKPGTFTADDVPQTCPTCGQPVAR
jgi:hypothetical protein